MSKLNTTDELISAISKGEMVILMDDEERENEGDIIMAAEFATADAINFMATHARGLICLSIEHKQADLLNLTPMVSINNAPLHTNFTNSIDAAEGITTGISAADRAKTIQDAIAKNATPSDIVQPGHIFPIVAQLGGVLRRAGHTEASCDLAKLAGCSPNAVIVEIMNADGSMARRDDLQKFAEEHNLKIGTIADLITYRNRNEKSIEKKSQHILETRWGNLHGIVYQDLVQQREHIALCANTTIQSNDIVPVRVHVANLFKDVLEAQQTNSNKWNLSNSLAYISQKKQGVVLIVNEHEPSLSSNLDWLQSGKQTNSHSYNQIGIGSQILRDLGIKKMQLLSHPSRFNALSGFGLEIDSFVEFSDDLIK